MRINQASAQFRLGNQIINEVCLHVYVPTRLHNSERLQLITESIISYTELSEGSAESLEIVARVCFRRFSLPLGVRKQN